MTIKTREKLKYRFEKINYLTWIDRYSTWTPGHKHYTIFLKAIKKEYPNVKIESFDASKEPYSFSHTNYSLSGDVRLVLKFKDEADEAEFIIRESS